MRNFSKKQKLATALVQDVSLDGNEADHIKPVAAGGKTDIENLQLIPKGVNRRKGAKFLELRHWQSEFVDRWHRRE